jgi:hypothetical protein
VRSYAERAALALLVAACGDGVNVVDPFARPQTGGSFSYPYTF